MKTKTQHKKETHARRQARIRAKVSGTAECPRLAVFKSNRFMYAQLIDDASGTTIVSGDSRKVKGDTPLARGAALGAMLAEVAKSKGIERIVFDRGGFRYQGTVAALADGAREGGLTF